LVIVGKGKDARRLKSKVKSKKSKVYFMGEVSDNRLWAIYKNARALIFPAEDEEFGIVPVEAMGHGVPVIAYASGGVVETVVEGKTGVFFDELSVDSLIKAIEPSSHRAIEPLACKKQARKFSKEKFARKIKKFVLDKL
jgi:glycosyltransferase involved in cell wall biosynthesis